MMPRDRSYGSQLKNNHDLAAVVQCRGGFNGSAMQLQAEFDKSHLLVLTPPDTEVSAKELV